MQVVSGCFGLLPQVLPYRALTGDDEYIQQPGREVLQRMCHKLSHQGELERAKRESFLSLTASGHKKHMSVLCWFTYGFAQVFTLYTLNLKPFPPCNLQQFSAGLQAGRLWKAPRNNVSLDVLGGSNASQPSLLHR